MWWIFRKVCTKSALSLQPVYQSWGWISKRIAPENRHKRFMTSIKNPRRSTAGRVEHIRLELTTSCMPCKRSTRWANAPLKNGHKSIPAAKVRRIFGVCKFICNILIKIQVPLFPRGMKGTKNFLDMQIMEQRPLAYYAKLTKFFRLPLFPFWIKGEKNFWDNQRLRTTNKLYHQWPIISSAAVWTWDCRRFASNSLLRFGFVCSPFVFHLFSVIFRSKTEKKRRKNEGRTEIERE